MKEEREEAIISAFMKQCAAALDAGTDAFMEQCAGGEFPPELDKRCRALIQQAFEKDLIDPSTGTKLTPSYHGRECLGNGEWLGYECCCDECDHYLTCFPEAK